MGLEDRIDERSQACGSPEDEQDPEGHQHSNQRNELPPLALPHVLDQLAAKREIGHQASDCLTHRAILRR
jgi:hypothetical protein